MNKCSKISGKVLVIQLGREETQLVLVGGGKEILYGVTVATPAGAVEDGVIRNPDAVRELLKTTLKENPELKKTRQTVFCLTTSQVITETVTTPDLSASKLEKLIHANADMYFPVDVQEYQLVWQSIGPKVSDSGLKEMFVQLWAVPNSMLNPYYTVANACGLSVVAIDYCGHSIANALGIRFTKPAKAGQKRPKLDLNAPIHIGKKNKVEPPVEEVPENTPNPDTDVYLLLDKDLLGMTCAQNGHVVFQRFIRCGVHPSYQLGELTMMLEYFKTMDIGRGSRLSGVYFGELAENLQLVEELADAMGIPMRRLDAAYSLKWVGCVGAAHTGLEFGIPNLNVPGKARKEIKSSLWQYALILVGGLMLVSSVFSLLTARLNWSSELTIHNNNVMALQAEAGKYDGYADKYEEYAAAYNAYSNDWDSVYASLQTYNDNLVLVMEELEQLLPEKSTVTDMQIGATGLNVTFACENKEQAAYIIMALRDMQYADLLAVSSLSGGGAGPATSYGTGRTGEKAPSEGGSDISTEDRNRLAASLTEDMDTYKVGYYLGLGKDTPDLLTDLAAVYGVEPVSSYESLEDVPVTFTQRTSAFYNMCMTNPFAMRAATDMLYEDYQNDGELSGYIKDDIKPSWYEHRSPTDLERDLDNMMGLIFYNKTYTIEELFPAIENLISAYPEAERWYLYYLEGELEGNSDLPYLDMDVMVDDLADGQFDSGIADMNTILTNLLSSDTLAILEEITAEPECSHNPIHVQAVAPTCDQAGNVEYWYCEKCPLVWLDAAMTQAVTADAVKLPAAHTALVQVTAKEPTATEDGWHAHWHCAGCGGYWMDAGLNVPTTKDAVTRPAVCTHSMTHFAPVAPDCEKAGNVEYWYCETCKTYWLDAAGTKPTTQEETVLAPEHIGLVAVDAKAPTETESGNVAYWHCTKCGGYWLNEGLTQPTDFDSIRIEPNGCKHTDLKHVERLEPTCEKPGNVEYWHCDKCALAWQDEALTQPILPANTVLPAAHKAVKVEAKEPTATESGNLEHWYCEVCQGYWLDEALTQPTDQESVTIPAVTGPSEPSETDPSDPSEPSDSSDPSDPSDPSIPEGIDKEWIINRAGEALVSYLETGKTGLTVTEELAIEMALQEYLPVYAGMSVEELLDEQLSMYFTDGASEFEAFDKIIEAYLAKNPEKEAELRDKYKMTIERALKEYLAKGRTIFEEGAVRSYVSEGTSRVTEYDDKLNQYVNAGKVDAELTDLIRDYRAGSITNRFLLQMFENFEKDEKNPALNDRLELLTEKLDSENEETAKEAVKYLKTYLQNGSADPRYNSLIRDFLMDGTVKDEKMDKIFEDHIKSGAVDAELTSLIYLYAYKNSALQTPAYAYTGILQMLNNYHNSESGTGSTVLDAQIKKCYTLMLNDYINKLNESNRNKATGQNNPTEKPDTRIFFTVVLSYNDELKLAELERKGLDYNEKLPDEITPKLEVEE